MRTWKWLLLPMLSLVFPSHAQTPVNSSLTYDGGTPTNQLLLSWETIPGKQYNVLTTTALGSQNWQVLNSTPVAASNNLVKLRQTNSESARFYKIVKLDTDPPEVWRLNPSSNAIAVGLQSPLKAYLRDETGIDVSSIVFNFGPNPPVTIADPRLAYTNGVLTYTPGTNEFLGTNAQTVSASLAVSDTLGHRITNAWPFQLELPTILASNIVLIGNASAPAAKTPKSPNPTGLTLVSTNGDTYVFSYTGISSGLTNGQVLVSTDPNDAYKRKILSITDDPTGHTVSLVTTQASLAECIQTGSIRLIGDFAQQSAVAGVVPKGAGTIGASIPLDGIVIYDNGTIRVEVSSGQITFNPECTASGDFQGGHLTSFDAEIGGTLGLDLTLQGTFTVTGDYSGTKPLITPIRKFSVLGFVGVVPVWVETDLEFNIGYTAHLEAQGSVTAGFQSSRTMTFGATLRNGQWSNFASQTSTFTPLAPSWQINGSATIQGYVEPKLTVYLESLAGPSVDLKPYLELDGNACLRPGQAGADISVYAGLSSTLAIDVRGWDKDWGNPPSWELFNLRGLIFHKNLSTTTGPAPQTIPNMVWIPCGTFTMGSPDSEHEREPREYPQTRVTISRGFWMGQYEVSQGEYLGVTGNNPSYINGDRSGPPNFDSNYGIDLRRPVEQVSWTDAAAYCATITQRERQAGRLPVGYVYRLPTEAEWEYACRAGTAAAFSFGPGLRSGMANFDGYWEYDSLVGTYYNSAGSFLARTTPVGSYAPNGWGLYDMHGNVWEWCQDSWGLYPGGSVTDPQGPGFGNTGVVRGGCWCNGATYCRSGSRECQIQSFNFDYVGFRVVLARPLQ